MNNKHRTTPVAPAPMQRTITSDRPPSHRLKAPIVVVTPVGEFEHERGGLVLGRAEDANVVLEDPLISRAHARLLVLSDETVVVEDLHSTNGVFVNGVRLARPSYRLSEGDRLLIGTTEVSVFSSRASATIPIEHYTGELLRRGPAPPASARGPVPPASARGPAPPASTRGPVAPAGMTARTESAPLMPSTGRSNAVELVGNLARRLMENGRGAEAVRVLSEHLNNVLLGASAGLSVPDSVLERASEHALELFRWTTRGAWIDYVFQLHLSCQRVPAMSVVALVERELEKHPSVDRELIDYFASSLRSRAMTLTADEQLVLARMALWAP